MNRTPEEVDRLMQSCSRRIFCAAAECACMGCVNRLSPHLTLEEWEGWKERHPAELAQKKATLADHLVAHWLAEPDDTNLSLGDEPFTISGFVKFGGRG